MVGRVYRLLCSFLETTGEVLYEAADKLESLALSEHEVIELDSSLFKIEHELLPTAEVPYYMYDIVVVGSRITSSSDLARSYLKQFRFWEIKTYKKSKDILVRVTSKKRVVLKG
jgi:hypothetical protein